MEQSSPSVGRGFSLWLLGACLWALLLLQPTAAAAQTSFLDVPPGFWGESFIATVTQDGVMDGCGGDFFCPYDPVTREDVSVWLERGINGAGFTPPAASGVFSDVLADYCLAPWIEQLYHDGVTSGCATNPLKYCPYKPLSRAEMAVFLLAAEHLNDEPPWGGPPPCTTPIFDDVPCSFWAAKWINQLNTEQITTGCSASPMKYCPNDQVTRAQMAVFLVRTFGLQ
jgi:hypothetical protein